jgi:flagellar basal-body rod protein FlgB
MSAVTSEMTSVNMFQDALDGSSERHSVISDNLANVNTPGYKRKEVAFKDKLQEAYMGEGPEVELHQGHPKHVDLSVDRPVEPSTFQVNDTSIRNDENNVDPDRQMAKLSKNSMYYRGLSQFLSREFQTLGTLIQDLKQD